MLLSPEPPHTSPVTQQTAPKSADQEQALDREMSAEEEAALCARYEEEKVQRENAETGLGSDWPDGPLTAMGCGW